MRTELCFFFCFGRHTIPYCLRPLCSVMYFYATTGLPRNLPTLPCFSLLKENSINITIVDGLVIALLLVMGCWSRKGYPGDDEGVWGMMPANLLSKTGNVSTFLSCHVSFPFPFLSFPFLSFPFLSLPSPDFTTSTPHYLALPLMTNSIPPHLK